MNNLPMIACNRPRGLTNCPALGYKATHATYLQYILHGTGQSAGMVELVDAADSKSAEGNLLRVQVSLPVPSKSRVCEDGSRPLTNPFLRLFVVYPAVSAPHQRRLYTKDGGKPLLRAYFPTGYGQFPSHVFCISPRTRCKGTQTVRPTPPKRCRPYCQYYFNFTGFGSSTPSVGPVLAGPQPAHCTVRRWQPIRPQPWCIATSTRQWARPPAQAAQPTEYTGSDPDHRAHLAGDLPHRPCLRLSARRAFLARQTICRPKFFP